MVKTHWEYYLHLWRVFYVNIHPGPWIILGNPENGELAGYIHIYIYIHNYIWCGYSWNINWIEVETMGYPLVGSAIFALEYHLGWTTTTYLGYSVVFFLLREISQILSHIYHLPRFQEFQLKRQLTLGSWSVWDVMLRKISHFESVSKEGKLTMVSKFLLCVSAWSQLRSSLYIVYIYIYTHDMIYDLWPWIFFLPTSEGICWHTLASLHLASTLE